MGSLKPGATYIYERVDGVVYAREQGSLQREAIGWDADAAPTDTIQQLEENKLWGNIFRASRTNQALREALDRAKIIYELSRKDDGQE